MEITYETDSCLIALIFLTVMTIIPVKIGANLVGALYTNIGSCALAVILGTCSVFIIFNIMDGFAGGVAAFIAISMIYWHVLKPSLMASFGLTVLVIFIQLAAFQFLNSIISMFV